LFANAGLSLRIRIEKRHYAFTFAMHSSSAAMAALSTRPSATPIISSKSASDGWAMLDDAPEAVADRVRSRSWDELRGGVALGVARAGGAPLRPF
jgi:hypothetical protein